ncbi:MAG: hypothetical protein U0694_11400 [Anaerolineae bacterium]
MYETLPLIQKLATERFELYRLPENNNSRLPNNSGLTKSTHACLYCGISIASKLTSHWSRPKATRLEPQTWDQAA